MVAPRCVITAAAAQTQAVDPRFCMTHIRQMLPTVQRQSNQAVTITVTAQELNAYGELLAVLDKDTYGRGWQSALARELGISDRMMRYYVAGKHKIPEPTAKLIKLIVRAAER